MSDIMGWAENSSACLDKKETLNQAFNDAVKNVQKYIILNRDDVEDAQLYKIGLFVRWIGKVNPVEPCINLPGNFTISLDEFSTLVDTLVDIKSKLNDMEDKYLQEFERISKESSSKKEEKLAFKF